MYQASWLILLAPLFAFAVIIFVTRVWDLLSRPRPAVAAAHGDGHGSHDAHDAHAEHVALDGHVSDSHGHSMQDEDDDPHVPALTTGARVSGYAAIVIMALKQ